MMKTRTLRRVVLGLLSLVAATPAYGSAERLGATFGVINTSSRGSAVAYGNDLYLVVSTFGTLRGRFVTADGGLVGEPFVIQASGNYTHFPRVAFSPHANNGAGAFLVVWHESDLPGGHTSVHARLVASPGVMISNDTMIGADQSWWEAGPAVAYGSGAGEFLVVWRGRFGSLNDISGVRIGNGGQVLGPVQVTSTVQYEDNPSVAYDPATNTFMVVYAGYNEVSFYAFVAAQRVQAGTGALLGAPVELVAAGGTYITDVTFNSARNQFLATWYQLPANAVYGRILGTDGSLHSDVLALSTRFKANDALSLAYNAVSDSYFVVSHDSQSAEDGGVHIRSDAVPEDTGFLVTAAGGTGNFYPRLSANAHRPEWLVSTSNSFTATVGQRVGTGASAGPGPAPGPTPGPVPNPRMSLDVPGNGSSAAGVFAVAGWAVDLGASTGTGVSSIHVWAFPANGASPIFLGVPTNGVPRPDVGAVFGANFTNSGFSMTALLQPGTYYIVAYAFSTITGSFNNSAIAYVTVVSPPTIPRMAVDLPSPSQTVSQNFTVAGWALDLGALSGVGVDAIHVWGYPVGGGSPLFAGATTTGGFRSDVAAAFGDARWGNAGFGLTGVLPPGEYDLVVFAHSIVSLTFNNVVIIRIRVV